MNFLSELSRLLRRIPDKMIGLALLGITLLVSIFVFLYYIPLTTEIAAVPLVNSQLKFSIPFKLVVGVCLVAFPLIFYFLGKGRFLTNIRKAISHVTPEAFVATLFLGQLVFQAKFSSSYDLAIKFVLLVIVFLLIAFVSLRYFALILERKLFSLFIRLYALLALGSILYVNFHAYNGYLLKSYFFILTFLVLCIFLNIVLMQKIGVSGFYHDLTFRIPFWIVLLLPSRVGLLGLHPFESFAYSNLNLLRKGFLPWQDFYVEHGIWEDLGRNLLGSIVGGPSEWGQSSGIVGFVSVFEFFILALLFFTIKRNVYLSIGVVLIVNYF